MSDQSEKFSGTCYCGECCISVVGDPKVMAYCHCHSCRKWHSAPVNAWCLWQSDKVTIEGPTFSSSKNEQSHRVSCSKCGGALANIKPGRDVVAVYAMTLAESDLAFKPIGHIFYEERVFDMADELPKWKTVPESFGGDGALIEEPDNTSWLA